MRTAIVGGGAAGLGAAWVLHKSGVDFTLYEAGDALGGHATTVDFPIADGIAPVDMGVILTSPSVYPNLYRTFAELGVETFGVAVDFGASFGGGEVWVTGRPRYGALWARVAAEAARFEAQMLEVLDLPPGSPDLLTPLGRTLSGYSSDFVRRVLLPLLSLFVVTRTALEDTPVAFVASYFRAVSLFSPTPWRLVRGGTRAYTGALAARLGPRVRLGAPVTRIAREPGGVVLTTEGGVSERYGRVVLAVDARHALALLTDADEAESRALSSFEYEDAVVYLHADDGVLSPDLPRDLLSQYVCPDGDARADLTGAMTYNVGGAMGIGTALVTVHGQGAGLPAPARVVATRRFRHVRVTGKGLLAQQALARLQGARGVWFCGAHTAAPTHEAAFVSGMVVAGQLGAALPYRDKPSTRRSQEQHAGHVPRASGAEVEKSPRPRPIKNPFLLWNFAPWREENDYPSLEVQGEVPAALAGGRLIRVGPSPAFDPIDPRRYTWIDGDGMLSEVRFGRGSASFRNRYVRTLRYELERAAGRALFGTIQSSVRETTPEGFAAIGMTGVEVDDLLSRVDKKLGPTESQYERISMFLMGANTSVSWVGGRLLAMEEAAPPYRIDPATLATLGVETFDGEVRGSLIAHPITDPRSGETFVIGYWPFQPHVVVYVIDAGGTVVRRVPVELPRPVMMHGFALTERHVVLLDLPTTYLPEDIGSACALRWRPELGARIGVIPRDSVARGRAEPRWFEIPLSWVFHVLNAFDDDGAVVLDVCRYDRVPLLDVKPGEVHDASLSRWRLDLGSGAFAAHTLVGDGAEFPTVDDRWKTRRHRHGYVVAKKGGAFLANTLVHVDFAADRLDAWTAGDGWFLGEAVFVPRGEGSPEGDGYLVGAAYDASENRSDVLVFDATMVSRGPIAAVKLPRRLPFDFHGAFLPP